VAATIALLLVAGAVLWLNLAGTPGAVTAPAGGLAIRVPVREEAQPDLGFGGEGQVADSVVVHWLPHAQYDQHYRFRDTLHLYLGPPAGPPDVTLRFDPQTSTYRLTLGGKTYRLEKGFNRVRPLVVE
jgi:hypothetical protein